MEVKITYLYNSGFLLRTGDTAIIFDYYMTSPPAGKLGLTGGVIVPEEIKNDNVYVFVSHAHYDHFNPVIFDWAMQIPNITYVLSDDIPKRAGAHMVPPDGTFKIGAVSVTTFKSTDEGVAFLIEFDNLTVYHAGDLNWWHWEGEDAAWNHQMAKDYKAQIKKLSGRRIDIAFAPIDPRLDKHLYLGAELLLKTADIGTLIPMHYGTSSKKVESLLNTLPKSERDKILPPLSRGQTVTLCF